MSWLLGSRAGGGPVNSTSSSTSNLPIVNEPVEDQEPSDSELPSSDESKKRKRESVNYAETNFAIKESKFTWIVKNLDIRDITSNEINSPVFQEEHDESSWSLLMCTGDVNNITYIQVGLKLVRNKFCKLLELENKKKKHQPVKARYTFELKYGDESISRGQNNEFQIAVFKSCGSAFYIQDFCEKVKLQTAQFTNTISRNIEILCKVFVYEEPIHRIGGELTSSDLKRAKIMVSSFSSIYEDRKFADAVITVDDEKFDVHKIILMAKSEVIDGLLRSDTIEGNSGNINMSQFDKEVVKGMIEFMYCGHTDSLKKYAHEFLEISDYYIIPELKNEAERFLYETLNVQSAAQCFHQAELFRAERLKKKALEFILQNRIAVSNTSYYKQMEENNGKLITQLFLG